MRTELYWATRTFKRTRKERSGGGMRKKQESRQHTNFLLEPDFQLFSVFLAKKAQKSFLNFLLDMSYLQDPPVHVSAPAPTPQHF